jgi:hypothetical protein
MSGQAPLTQKFQEVVPALTILAGDSYTILEAPYDGEVTEVSYIPDSNITGADSPASRTLTLINKGQAGNGTTVMATLAFTLGTDATDFNESLFTLSAVEGAVEFVEGDVLALNSAAVGGTGLVDPGGTIQVTVSRA